MEVARRRLYAVVDDYLNRTDIEEGQKTELVGVHVRRGDHLQYEERMGWDLLTGEYFLKAMDLYRERLSQPIFLIVTDDPVWVRSEIAEDYLPHYTTGRSHHE